MGAIFPVLDREVEGVDISSVGGKMINRFAPELDEIVHNFGVKGLMDFFGANPADYLDESELADVEIPEEYLNGKWFEPKDGLNTVKFLIKHLNENIALFKHETAFVIEDLREFEKVLQKAEKAEAKWHVEIDI